MFSDCFIKYVDSDSPRKRRCLLVISAILPPCRRLHHLSETARPHSIHLYSQKLSSHALPIMRIPFFRIFYSTTFTVFALILFLLLLVTPADQIYQAFKNRQIYNVFIVGATYLITLLTAVVLYAFRLYTNRAVVAAIPKTWSPTEKGDVGKRVRRLVIEHLERSALITYVSRPRDLRDEKASATSRGLFSSAYARRRSISRNSNGTATSIPHAPVWGTISHPGWSSPSSPDLPNLQYQPVILELPHLIEAKAVSLAPPDPLFDPDPNPSSLDPSEPPIPDAAAVGLLQRPATMGLREYISHLLSLNLITPPSLSTEFLALYEKSRFSGEELDEFEFRTLMNTFADILRSMDHLDPVIVADLHANFGTASESSGPDAASLSSTNTVAYTPRPSAYVSASTSSDGSRAGSPETTRTAPSFSHSNAGRNIPSRASGSTHEGIRMPSLASLRPVRTEESGTSRTSQRSGGSVIRLVEARGPLDLPYTIVTGEGEAS